MPTACALLVTSTLSIVHAAKLVCYPWMEQGMASNYTCEECEGTSLYIGLPFQNEASIAEELSVSNITTVVVKNGSLQVPFPTLNKILPEGFAGPDPASSRYSDDKACVPTRTDACPTTTEVVTGTGAGVLTEAGMKDLAGKQTNLTTSQLKELPASATLLDEGRGDVNWLKLAQEFILVLQGAILSRVNRAPRFRHDATSRTMDNDSSVEILSGSRSEGKLSAASCMLGGKGEGKEKVDMRSFSPQSPSLAAEAVRENQRSLSQGKARVGILFSGGVDSVVLAALTDR